MKPKNTDKNFLVGSDKADGEQPDRTQILQWWRLHAPSDLHTHVGDFQNELVLRTRGLVEDEVMNRVALKEERRQTALRVACQLVEEHAHADLVMSWLALAGLLGDALAARIVYDDLIERAIYIAARDGIEAACPKLNLAMDWGAHIGSVWAHGFRCLLSEVGRSDMKEKIDSLMPPASDPVTIDVKRRGIEDGANITVVQAIGDASGREGRDAAARYRRLTKPLPLVGGGIAPAVLRQALQLEFPWLESAIDAIVGDLRLLKAGGVPWIRFRPLLLVGPPGVGKTRFAKRLGSLAGTGCELSPQQALPTTGCWRALPAVGAPDSLPFRSSLWRGLGRPTQS